MTIMFVYESKILWTCRSQLLDSSAGMVLTLVLGVYLAITISPDSCLWVIGAIWINGSELLDLACSMFEFDKSSR